MAVRIIERGRGPEIEGTRVTVYRIMDFIVDPTPLPEIARQLALSEDEVRAALDYIEANRAEVEAEYARIVERANSRKNPEWVERTLAKSWDELRQCILARRTREATDEGKDRK